MGVSMQIKCLVGSRLKCPGGRMGGRGPGEGEEEAGCEPG